MASSTLAVATTLCETPLFRRSTARRPIRKLSLGARVEVRQACACAEASSSQDTVHRGLVRVSADGDDGYVERSHLRIKIDAVRRSIGSRKLFADGKSGLGKKAWSKPFFFLQLADSQLGMQQTFDEQPAGWAREEALLRHAIAEINRLRPAFAIVCGDLIDAFPGKAEDGEDGKETQMRAEQTFDFQLACEQVDPAIPLVCVCGNHDVGNRPTAATIDLYKRVFGDDYFTFFIDGVKCIVLNSQLWKDGSAAPDLRDEQWRWLKAELAKEETANARQVLVRTAAVSTPRDPSTLTASLLAPHR